MPRIRVSISYLSESEQKTSTESRQKLTNVNTSQRALIGIGRKVLCRRREGDYNSKRRGITGLALVDIISRLDICKDLTAGVPVCGL